MRISGFGSSLRLAALAALLMGGVSGAQAGFFERLFGMEPEPEPQRYYYQPAPSGQSLDYGDEALDLTVRKAPKARAVRKERKREAVETATVPPEQLDPAKNADWYLQDPTLRRGDIVVLKGEVLVFQGGRLPFSRANFASLAESDLPKAERERLAHMAGLKPVLPPRTAVASAGN